MDPAIVASPLTPVIGAEVVGLDLSQPLKDTAVTLLRKMLLRFGVLIFRDQYSLTRESHIEVGEKFGKLESYPAGELTHPKIVRLYHGPSAPPTENVWHSDMSFRADPPLGSILRAMVVPPTGGDTLFCDMRNVWRSLPPKVQHLIRDLDAEHDIAKLAPTTASNSLHLAAKPVHHPILRMHPETDDEILYVNPAYTTRVVGLSDHDGAALLNYLFAYINLPESQCRIRWRSGTVLFWDNRSVQHYAVADYMPEVRIMERVSISGDAPLRFASRSVGT
jgi:taurine dioxygenase